MAFKGTTPTLYFAAILLILVGFMHSLVGGKRLINPILARDDLPIILGNIQNTRLTLLIGWHALTLFWWGEAGVLLSIATAPELARTAFLIALSLSCGIIGLSALLLSRGSHKSWVFFMLISGITAWAVWVG